MPPPWATTPPHDSSTLCFGEAPLAVLHFRGGATCSDSQLLPPRPPARPILTSRPHPQCPLVPCRAPQPGGAAPCPLAPPCPPRGSPRRRRCPIAHPPAAAPSPVLRLPINHGPKSWAGRCRTGLPRYRPGTREWPPRAPGGVARDTSTRPAGDTGFECRCGGHRPDLWPGPASRAHAGGRCAAVK